MEKEQTTPAGGTDAQPAPVIKKSGGIWKAIAAFFAGLSIMLAVGGVIGYFAIKGVGDAASGGAKAFMDTVAGAFSNLTGKKVEVQGNSIYLPPEDIEELALVEQEGESFVRRRTKLAGDSAVLILKGTFRAKAGFDLADGNYSVTANEANQSVDVKFPPAKILSVEMEKYEVYHLKDGFINKITEEDHEEAVRQLIRQARDDFELGNLRREAENRLRERLEDYFLGTGEAVDLYTAFEFEEKG